MRRVMAALSCLTLAAAALLGLSTAANAATKQLDVAPSRTLNDGKQMMDVAYDLQGNLYVADMSDNAVKMWAPGWTSGALPTRMITGGDSSVRTPVALTVDAQGRLYVLNAEGGVAVQVYAADWSQGAQPIKTLSIPEGDYSFANAGGLAVDSHSNLYITHAKNETAVLRWDNGWMEKSGTNIPPDRVLAGTSTGLSTPFGIAFDGADKMYVSNMGDEPGDSTITQYTKDWPAGNTAPVRTLAGPATTFGDSFLYRLGVDPAGTTYAAIGEQITEFSAGWKSGDTAPNFTFSGEATGLISPKGAAVDPKTAGLAVIDWGTQKLSLFQGAPIVRSVSPTTGTTKGGTTITVIGAGFLSGAAVKIGGANCTGVKIVSVQSLTCKTPTGTLGKVDVKVTNSDSQFGSKKEAFAFVNPGPAPAPVAKTQTPVGGCAATSVKKLKKSGLTKLASAKCKTNAGQIVGVTVGKVSVLATRGDVVNYRLVCKVGKKLTKPAKKSQGAYCKKGTLNIQTSGRAQTLAVRWSSPKTKTYKKFVKTGIFVIK